MRCARLLALPALPSLAVPALAAALACVSCMDPVHSDRVDALGPEVNGQKPGPTHRPGQPCTTCHGGSGPGSPEFVVAGTIYASVDGNDPAPGVDVQLTASDGRTITLRTNAVGNFYLPRKEWDAPFPMKVKLAAATPAGQAIKQMTTRMGGEGGCAFCHRSPSDSSHMPHVYLGFEGPAPAVSDAGVDAEAGK